jgi:hypothetical protein
MLEIPFENPVQSQHNGEGQRWALLYSPLLTGSLPFSQFLPLNTTSDLIAVGYMNPSLSSTFLFRSSLWTFRMEKCNLRQQDLRETDSSRLRWWGGDSVT